MSEIWDDETVLRLNEYLLRTIKKEEIFKYDYRIKELLEQAYGNTSIFHHNNATEEVGGIFQQLLKNWKSIEQRSSLTKTLPCILTGITKFREV